MCLPYVLLTPGTDTGMGLLVEGPFWDFPSSKGPDSGIPGPPLAQPISGFFLAGLGGRGRGSPPMMEESAVVVRVGRKLTQTTLGVGGG